MSCRRKLLILAAITLVLCAVMIGGAVKMAPSAQQAIFYPKPKSLPAVVATPLPDLLVHLEAVLQAKAPKTAAALQPGLSATQIAALEAKGGLTLTPDLRALYGWRNGIPASANLDLIPGHRFLPLEEAIDQRIAVQAQFKAMSPGQKISFQIFAGHRLPWLYVMADGSDDGYHYDPNRLDSEGSFFFNFAEDGWYIWFPSLRNFLAGAVENFESGAYTAAADGISIEENYERVISNWDKYGESGGMGQ